MLLYEPFDYPNGEALTAQLDADGNRIWTGVTGDQPLEALQTINGDDAGDNGTSSLEIPGLPSRGGRVRSTQRTGGNPDLNLPVPITGEGSVLYVSFLYKPIELGTTYFAHNNTDGNYQNQIGRLESKSDNAPNTTFYARWREGDSRVSEGGAGHENGTTVFLVFKTTLVPGEYNDTLDLWIDPEPGEPEPDPTVTAGADEAILCPPAEQAVQRGYRSDRGHQGLFAEERGQHGDIRDRRAADVAGVSLLRCAEIGGIRISGDDWERFDDIGAVGDEPEIVVTSDGLKSLYFPGPDSNAGYILYTLDVTRLPGGTGRFPVWLYARNIGNQNDTSLGIRNLSLDPQPDPELQENFVAMGLSSRGESAAHRRDGSRRPREPRPPEVHARSGVAALQAGDRSRRAGPRGYADHAARD